ncbi:MAG TPA: STAS domain-containing protein [Candidatus Baltobacteraceae bacterium]|jgi:anti-anti-sigma factor|nr:STAS domain-containing protein [Candidatus Baltobacteraceae bacterium]
MDPSIVSLSGEFDIDRQHELRETLEPFYAQPYLIVDLSRVEYVDSSCLCEFMRMRRARSDAGARPACFVVDERRFGRLFHFLGLDEVFPVVHSLEEAFERVPERELAMNA